MLVPRTALHLHFQKLRVKRLISSAGQLFPVCCLCHGAAAPLGVAVGDRDCDRDSDHGPLHQPCHGVGSAKLVTILFRPFPGRGCPEPPRAAAETSWDPPAPGPLAVPVCHRWGTAGGTERGAQPRAELCGAATASPGTAAPVPSPAAITSLSCSSIPSGDPLWARALGQTLCTHTRTPCSLGEPKSQS